MKTDELLKTILTPFVPTLRHGSYDGNETTYLTYVYNRLGTAFGDNRARAERQLVMLHLWCPDDFDETELVDSVAAAIAGCEDFTYPDISDTSDGGGKRYTFEFERIGEAL